MTRRDIMESVHEPFGDAFYYGPEFLSDRFRDEADQRERSGFADKTYKDIFDQVMDAGKEVRLARPLLFTLLLMLFPNSPNSPVTPRFLD